MPRPPALLLLVLLLPPLLLRLLLAAAARTDGGCPRSLDCTLQRRAMCTPGSHTCGSCLRAFVEDEHGLCVPRKQLAGGRIPSLPNLEEEINFLADVLSRQAVPSQEKPHPAEPAGSEATGKESRLHPSHGRPLPHYQGSPGAPTEHPTLSSRPVKVNPLESHHLSNDIFVLGMIVVCTVAGASALIVAAACWCRLQKEIRLAQKTDYLAQKVSSSPERDKTSPGDKKLAQSAQMYHYQHQKQQMLSMEKNKEEPRQADPASSDEENEDGDFTVYECPGLAPTGEMEVRNPLFEDWALSPPPKTSSPLPTAPGLQTGRD
ncbi:neural proliferation differentiation and control protein 1 [Ornithorhynchus anatinus]|uniref:neural proliferation differentiation and control protein 1 n=1 Tax=Ornithorhynchus anatinus TaxID=9258 RepID=UPI0010A7E9DF|nr:neural proliferation differentiation and control protein 1 [Ornithorhynchus anatinus]